MRLVKEDGGEIYYTDSHYAQGSFVKIAGP
jgi:hypothetical protein